MRAFLVAEAISAIGTWATLIAIWGYAAYEFDATAGEVSLFGVALTAPAVVLGPVVGSVVDRFGPRLTLGLAKTAGVLASLALLLADDFRTLALLSVIHGVVGAFTNPALQALPPRIVPDSELARANALVSLTDEFAIVMGPVVGAVAIGAFGFRGAFVVDALRRGEQIALARKGGLRDARGFELRADAFWLFPTAFHADLSAYARAAGTASAPKALDALAAATGTFEVRAEDAPKALRVLSARSGWPEDLFARRANWKPGAPLVILEVRCYEAR